MIHSASMAAKERVRASFNVGMRLSKTQQPAHCTHCIYWYARVASMPRIASTHAVSIVNLDEFTLRGE